MQNNYSPKNRNKQSPLASIHSDITLQQSRSRVTQNKKKIKVVNSQDYDPDDNIRMINQSMIELQDPKFIADQIDEFQSRLPTGPSSKGFCKVSREMSLMLSNTQGYRKYKNQTQLKQKDNRVDKSQEKQPSQNPVSPQQVRQVKKQQKQQKQLDKQQSKSKSIPSSESSQSLNYSSDSRQRRSRRQQKKQSIQSIDNNSNITNNSIDFYKSEIRVQPTQVKTKNNNLDNHVE